MIGTKLTDRYELTEELGRGGMGVVYKAADPLLGRDVAIKMIPPQMLTESAVERFQREARAVAQMDHPAIVPIHDFGEHEGSFFFVMPLVAGENLRSILDGEGLTLDEILEVGIQTAEALDYSHSRDVIHRDIKPENLMIVRERGGLRVRVMDFGLAQESSNQRLTRTQNVLGTVAYLSPEHVQETGRIDGRGDLYSLSVVLYECLSGATPFSGPTPALIYRIIHEHPRGLQALGCDVDPELETILLNCLEKQPDARPTRGQELAAALRAYRDRQQEERLAQRVRRDAEQASSSPSTAGAPLVGRRNEIREMQEALQRAQTGECQLLLFGGDAGAGKSRLLQELESLALARGVRVLQGRFADRESTFPYQGFCELIQDYFRGLRRDASRSGKTPSGEQPALDLPDIADLVPDLLALFPVFSEIEELRQAGGEAGSGEISLDEVVSVSTGATADDPAQLNYVFELLSRTLTRLADGRPLVLLLENLHAADLSIDGLQYVFRRLGPTPTLIAGAYRREELDRTHPLSRLLHGMHDDPRVKVLNVGPLEENEFHQLSEQWVGHELPSELSGRLFEATEGNPYFAQELIKSLMESGGMRREASGDWSLPADLSTLGRAENLPATIQQAVERRLERLPEQSRGVLATAAVLGRDFDFRDLEELQNDSDDLDLDEIVEDLIRRELLEEDRRARGDRLRFTSGMVRDVLYQELSRRRRRILHRRHAEGLEERWKGRLERVYPQLVQHFSEADQSEETVRYGALLARQALEAFRPQEAIKAVRTAMDFLDEDDDEVQGKRGEFLEIRARAHRGLGRLGPASTDAAQAISAFERGGLAGGAAQACRLAAEIAWQERDGDAALRWVEKGNVLARVDGPNIGEPAFEQVETLRSLLTLGATVANLRGEQALARTFLDEVENLAPEEEEELNALIPEGGSLRIALSNRLMNIDPGGLRIDEEAEISAVLFDTLLRSEDDGRLVPRLAEEWSAEEGGRRFTFRLRSDVRFSDGSPLRAADVKRSLERAAQRRASHPSGVFSALTGAQDWLAGRAEGIAGIEAHDEDGRPVVVFHLDEPLPIFPALLTDQNTAVVRERTGEQPALLGTGPFLLPDEHQFLTGMCERTLPTGEESERIVLERNPEYRAARPPRLRRVKVHFPVDASGIAQGLRSGKLDLGRDLMPQDLEEILRNPSLRPGLVETTKKNTYFLIFHRNGPHARDEALRRILTEVLRPRDLVWRTLGRFAQPADCLLPPGFLGHDAGRRMRSLGREQAIEELRKHGVSTPLTLRMIVHPLMLDRYNSLTEALLEEWRGLQIEVEIVGRTLGELFAAYESDEGFDVVLSRWNANYDDPDDFTYGLFHSRAGVYRRWCGSQEIDPRLEKARQETRTEERRDLYRECEEFWIRRGFVRPLFHEIDYRIGGPQVRGLRLGNAPPYVNYDKAGKSLQDEQSGSGIFFVRWNQGGEIHVPSPVTVKTLDPHIGTHVEECEVSSTIFETLTRVEEGARIAPWLASSFAAEDGGRSFRFHLRSEVRFHDGRRLTARDVRYSLERFLQRRATFHFLLSPLRGADALYRGDTRTLAGLRIVSATEIVFELEKPMNFFPALLTHPSLSILPEGSEQFVGRWRDGCVGTGPFRVVGFDPGHRLDLEANPDYWRPGFPKSESLFFHFDVSSDAALTDLEAGRFSLVGHLLPDVAEKLRRDPEKMRGYAETPRLMTYFLAFNRRKGVFADPELRHTLRRALEIDRIRRETLGGSVVAANNLLPPSLLASPADELDVSPPSPEEAEKLRGLRVRVLVHHAYRGQYGRFWQGLRARMEELGLEIIEEAPNLTENLQQLLDGVGDMTLGRWGADYPDPDGFAYGLLAFPSGMLTAYGGDSEIDRLTKSGREERDASARRLIYRDLEASIAHKGWVLPLFHEQMYRFCHPTVRGLRFGLTVPEVRYEELYAIR